MDSKFPPTKEQQKAIDLALTGQDVVIEAGAGCGKALRNDQRVRTPNGWTPIGDLSVGDQVIGTEGIPIAVTGVYPQGVVPLVEMSFSNGTGRSNTTQKIVASDDHLWSCQTKHERDKGKGFKVRTTAEMVKLNEDPKTRGIWLPMTDAVKVGRDSDLQVDSWLIGALIGDGGMSGRGVNFTNSSTSMWSAVERSLPDEVTLGPRHGITRSLRGMASFLRPLGLMGSKSIEKSIPGEYLYADVDSRRALISGLLDTDGTVSSSTGAIEYSTSSPTLAEQFCELVESMGGTCGRSSRMPAYTHKGERLEGERSFRLRPLFPADYGNPFLHCETKVAAWVPAEKYRPARKLVAVARLEDGEATCITVDAPDRLFLTEGHIVTHNSSTLAMIAERQPDKRFVFTAFNKLIVKEAADVMPDNVKAKTMHSLCFYKFGVPRKDRLNQERVSSDQVAKHFGITSLTVKTKMGPKHFSRAYIAALALKGIKNFCTSDNAAPSKWNIPLPPEAKVDPELKELYTQIRDEAAQYIQMIWDDMSATTGTMRIEHGVYLKLAELEGHQFGTDVLMVDEAQDLSPVMVSLCKKQKGTQLIAVGDNNQQINGFIGSVSLLKHMTHAQRCWLTESFRFGSEIAEVANDVLSDLATSMKLTGLGGPSKVVELDNASCYLFRTNAGCVSQVFIEAERGRTTHVTGGTEDIERFCLAAKDLKAGRRTDHRDLASFDTWGRFLLYVEEDPMAEDLRAIVKLIDDFGIDSILRMLARQVPMKQADVVLSTAHRTKGMAFESVKIGSDFKAEREDIDEDGLMLLYVAVTRAKKALDISECGFFMEGSDGPARDADRRQDYSISNIQEVLL